MSKTLTKKELSPADFATLLKTAELQTKGKTTTCDFYSSSSLSRGRIEYAPNYNPSKRGYFKGLHIPMVHTQTLINKNNGKSNL